MVVVMALMTALGGDYSGWDFCYMLLMRQVGYVLGPDKRSQVVSGTDNFLFLYWQCNILFLLGRCSHKVHPLT